MSHNIKFDPEFYFNFNSSILGSLSPKSFIPKPSFDPWGFHSHTSVTLCQFNGKIKKLTRNDGFGDADDHRTKAVYTFSHFTAICTQQNIILCDLQGKICDFADLSSFSHLFITFQVCLTITRSCVWSIPKAICTFLIHKIYTIRNEPWSL